MSKKTNKTQPLMEDKISIPDEIMKSWKRTRSDSSSFFVKHPFELEIIEKDFYKWLKELGDKVESESYSPKEMMVCNVPKGNGLIRPGSSLQITDYFYFNYLVGKIYPKIVENLGWSQENVDFGYILSGDDTVTDYKWIKYWLTGSERFRSQSLKLIEEGFTHIIVTDITGFYENISHRVLSSDLAQLGVDKKIAGKIIKALSKWSIVDGQGLPQSCSPSHILAKVYANPIDLELANYGFTHLRYVDDIRIFCKSEVEAKKAIVQLIISLRERGLNIQSSKTKIYNSEKALEIINGVQNIIEEIKSKVPEPQASRMIKDIEIEDAISNGSTTKNTGTDEKLKAQNDRLIENEKTDPSIYFVEELFQKEFLNSNEFNFNKTLFRFLLNKLGEFKSKIALNYCEKQLIDNPQETTTILNYVSSLNSEVVFTNAIGEFLLSKNSIYPYQNYQLISWITSNASTISNNCLKSVRMIENDLNNPHYLIAVAREFLGKFGNIADLNRVMSRYRNAKNEMEQVEIICSLGRLESSKRNGFYGLIKDDNDLNEKAINYVKSKN